MDSSSLDTILKKFSSMELAISSIKNSQEEIKAVLNVVMANKQSNTTTGNTPPPEICKRLDESYVLRDANENGKGLRNKDGERNSFLNVIIQSLWHLRPFKDEFFRRLPSGHVRVGEPCVTCALYDIFISLSTTSTDGGIVVAPTSLRVALSNLCRASKTFQEGEKNDAAEVLELVLTCLHKSFNVSPPVVSDTESADNTGIGSSWECNNGSCIAHSIFGMDIVDKMHCYCGLESRYLKYTSFFHYVLVKPLGIMKGMFQKESFAKVLDLVVEVDWLRCNLDAGGCGNNGSICHFICRQPHVFTLVLVWKKPCSNSKDIMATLAAISDDIDISHLYLNGVNQSRHRLVSVVCYCRGIYSCFCYSDSHAHWILYADETIEVIGSWSDVVKKCRDCLIQPQVLFFEIVNKHPYEIMLEMSGY